MVEWSKKGLQVNQPTLHGHSSLVPLVKRCCNHCISTWCYCYNMELSCCYLQLDPAKNAMWNRNRNTQWKHTEESSGRRLFDPSIHGSSQPLPSLRASFACLLEFFKIEQEGRASTEILLKLKNDRVRSKQEDKLQDNKLQEEITAGYNCQR